MAQNNVPDVIDALAKERSKRYGNTALKTLKLVLEKTFKIKKKRQDEKCIIYTQPGKKDQAKEPIN